jgi:dTDP-4-dehydrorhamnose reductase
MNILCFGQTGQVAIELARQAYLIGATVDCLDRERADLTAPDACAALVAATDADIIVNAAAYTAVDAAETDSATAQTVNGDSPGCNGARRCGTRPAFPAYFDRLCL